MEALRWAFIGPDGLRQGWRFLLFAAAIVLLIQFCEKPVVEFAASQLHTDPHALSAPAIFVSDGVDLIFILVVTGIAALLERRRVDSYGLPVNKAFSGLFWNGVLAALAMVVFVGAAMLLAGGMRIHRLALHGVTILASPLSWLMAMLFVGLTEEYLFRGYALQSLWRGAGFWPAALITTGIFAGDHLEKPHENAIDIGMIFALGLLMCLSVRVTGSLWWAVGVARSV